MADYSADPAGLARKLGVTPGCSIWLLDAPAPSAALLRSVCPPDVALTETEAGESGNGQERFDLIFLWPQRLDGLTERRSHRRRSAHVAGQGRRDVVRLAVSAQRSTATPMRARSAAYSSLTE